MELIRKLSTRKDKKGHFISYGIFLCPYCFKEIEKRLEKGRKQKSCGCQTSKEISESKMGKLYSEEHKKKISKTRIEKELSKGKNNPNYGNKYSEEVRQKISEANKDKIITEETRKIWSEQRKGKNNPNYRNGDKIRGDKHWNWQEGISNNPYPPEFNKELKQFILERDSYICQNPRCTEIHKRLVIHHIDYDKNNNNLNNLIVLGNSCHIKTNYNRQYFIEFYQTIMMNRIMGCLL